jgi:uncharacterized protein YkwD
MPGRQSARHHSGLSTSLARWAGLALAVAAVVASVAAAGFYLSRTARGPVQTEGAAFAPASCPPGEQAKAGSCEPRKVDRKVAQTGLGTGIGSPPRSRARAAHHRGRHPASPSPTPTPSSPAPSSPAQPSPTPTPTPTQSSPQPSPAPAPQGDAAAQVLALINQARAQAGLPAYSLSSGLGTSSARHNAVMAGGCGLSHQCPGEPSLGQRETNAGVQWTAAGENIGEGGPVADSSSAIAQMATRITQSMLDEQPPSDGHRENILSRTFRFIGITVTRDSHGTVWMTQDFSN